MFDYRHVRAEEDAAVSDFEASDAPSSRGQSVSPDQEENCVLQHSQEMRNFAQSSSLGNIQEDLSCLNICNKVVMNGLQSHVRYSLAFSLQYL